MRLILAAALVLVAGFSALQAKPVRKEKTEEPREDTGPFKAVDINNVIGANDPIDPKMRHASKKYTFKLSKDKTYVIDLISTDFDAYLRLLDKKGKQLAEDDDSGGNLNSRIAYPIREDGEYEIVVTSFDGQIGRFNLKVREVEGKK